MVVYFLNLMKKHISSALYYHGRIIYCWRILSLSESLIIGEEINVPHKACADRERAIEEPDPRRSAEMKRMVNAM